jgi:methionyl-tRNA formyltransferase
LLDLVSPKGAEMLVKGIRDRVFVPPLKDAVWRAAAGDDMLIHAAKIMPEDRHVDWQNWTRVDISRRQRVLGPLWNTALVPVKSPDNVVTFQNRRIILTNIEEVSEPVQGSERLTLLPGVPFILGRVPASLPRGDKALYTYASDGQLLRLREVKVEGQQANDGLTAALKAHMLSDRTIRLSGAEFSLSYNPLF